MPNPQDVNPHNFKVKTVIYNDGEFSIAWGTWEGGDLHLAMRWNGTNDSGYPKTFGHPVWFLIPKGLTFDIIQGILKNNNTDKDSIISVIDEIK